MKTIFTLLLLLFSLISLAQDKIYVHTATAANTFNNATFIDHPDLNDNPNAGIVFVHTTNPNGLPVVPNNNVTGLWYSTAMNQWAIFNEDNSQPMVEGSHYMVYIADDPNTVITHVATAANQGSGGNYTTVIDDPRLNGTKPGPFAVMAHYFNPNNVYITKNYGFYYDDILDKRGLYAEVGAIPEGAGFKVLIGGEGVTQFLHTATSANTDGHITTIDHPELNGNPDATFVFSHYFGVAGSSSEKNLNALTSVLYFNGFWRIYCEDLTTTIQEGTAFDVIVAPQDVLGVIDNQLATTVTMYPNPAKTTVNFTATENIETITIFNMLGQEVLRSKENANNVQGDVSALSNGNYLAKVQTNSGVQTLQLVKE